ncbi:MAG TPA: hypothetical protein P5076_16740, partial [Myxococcota bacterium]|nr:hypothetical protein [Myxococcota bacterium]
GFVIDGYAPGLDKAGLDAQVFLGLEPASAKRFSDWTEGVQDVHLERYLPADSVFALKARVNIERVLQTAFSMEPGFKAEYDQALQEADKALGAGVEGKTVKNLTGNFALGVRFGQADQVNQLIDQLRRMGERVEAQPDAPITQALQVFYWAQIRDASAWAQLVEKVLPLLTGEAKLTVDRQSQGSLTTIRLAGGELRYDVFLLHGKDVVGGCLGTGCAELAAQLVDGKADGLPSKVSQSARALLEEPSLAVGFLGFERVLAVLKGLDADVFGEGGMLAKMAVDLATTAVQNLRELTAVVRFLPEGVHFAGHLEIQ